MNFCSHSSFLTLCLLIGLLGCPTNAKLPIRGSDPLASGYHEHTIELIRQAPIAALGTIRSFQVVGGITTTSDDRRYPVQLKRITFSVETILRGTILNPEIDIFVYQLAPFHTLKGNNFDYNVLQPGGRRIYFLILEDGRYRCFQDVYRSYLSVRSGRHSNFRVDKSKPLEHSIAEVLLTPGDEIDPDAFGNGNLALTISFARLAIGKARTLALLRPLLAHPDARIRDWAGVQVPVYFTGQDSCLDDLAKRQDLPDSMRAQAAEYLEIRKRRDEQIKYWFSRDPMEWLRSDANSEEADKILDSLLILTVHRDAEIRRMACAYMSRRFPQSYRPDCGTNLEMPLLNALSTTKPVLAGVPR